MKYRKKPVAIEAVQFNGQNSGEIIEFCDGKYGRSDKCYVAANGGGLIILTLKGRIKATKGDYIIKDVAGEFYPCKPEIFKQTYHGVKITILNKDEK